MAETIFGLQLAKLRREKNVTQEQIADYLGVSPQAISKWENGSYPNGDLLPRLADYFGVSIDYLYGREKKDVPLEQQIMDAIQSLAVDEWKYEDRMEQVFRYAWAMQLAFWKESKCYTERVNGDGEHITASSVTTQAGFSYMRLNRDLEYYAVVKEPADGFSSYFQVTDRLVELFAFLGKEEHLKVLFYMLSLDNDEGICASTVAKRLKLSEECVKEALEYLCSVQGGWGCCMFHRTKLVDEHNRHDSVYTRQESASAAMLLLFAAAESILKPVHSYALQVAARGKGWLDRES